MASGLAPLQFRVAKVNGRVAVGDKGLCIADARQAKVLNTTPEKLAQGWASALKKALVAATANQ